MCRLINIDFFSLPTTDDKRARRWSLLIQLLFYERKYNKYFCDIFKEYNILNSMMLTYFIVFKKISSYPFTVFGNVRVTNFQHHKSVIKFDVLNFTMLAHIPDDSALFDVAGILIPSVSAILTLTGVPAIDAIPYVAGVPAVTAIPYVARVTAVDAIPNVAGVTAIDAIP